MTTMTSIKKQTLKEIMSVSEMTDFMKKKGHKEAIQQWGFLNLNRMVELAETQYNYERVTNGASDYFFRLRASNLNQNN